MNTQEVINIINAHPATNLPISGLTAAIAGNSIDNLNNQQTWAWNTLGDTIGLDIRANTIHAGNGQTLLQLGLSGANTNNNVATYGMQIDNLHTGTGSINYGLRVAAAGGATNYGLVVSAGNSGFGTIMPDSILHVVGNAKIIAPTNIFLQTILSVGDHSRSSIEFTVGGLNLTATNDTNSSGTILFNCLLTRIETGTVRMDQYGDGTVTGTPAYSLFVDSSGNIIEGSTVPSLTATQIAFGDGSNLMRSSSSFTFDGTNFVAEANGSIQPQRTGGVFGLVASGSNKIMVNTTTGLVQLGDVDNNSFGDIFTMNEQVSSAYYDNTAHNGKFGINTDTPGFALDMYGQINVLSNNADLGALQYTYADGVSNNIFIFNETDNGHQFTLQVVAPSVDRHQRFQDNSGIIALLTDIASVSVGSGDLVGVSTSEPSIATFTTSSATGTFRIGGYINLTVSSASTLTLKVTYTDENNNLIVQIIPLCVASTGTIIQSATSPGNYSATDIQIRVLANSDITVSTAAVIGDEISYDVGATIEKLR